MKEGFFILLVIFVVLGLTALRYRKQITGMIGLARALKDAKDAAADRSVRSRETSGVQLVQCAKCGIWVPQNKASRRGPNVICEACN